MKLKFQLDRPTIEKISVALASLIAAILTALFAHSCTINRIVKSANSSINNEFKVDSASTDVNTQIK